jgi:hypothetical protein
MKFPATEGSFKAEGWTFTGSRKCEQCPAMVHFWRNPKTHKDSPYVQDADGNYTSHFADCPGAKLFKRPK